MNNVKSFGCVLVAVCVLAAAVVGLFQVPQMIEGLRDSRASELRAEEGLERARTDREHQRSVDWQREFQLYSVTLAAYLDGNAGLLVAVSAALGACAAVLATSALGRLDLFK